MRFLAIAFALIALAGCQKQPESPPANQASPAAEAGPVKGIDRSHKGKSAPQVEFKDGDGITVSLDGFRGRPVLINLWATWCAPCVKELPTLDRLSKSIQGGSLDVLAINQDSASQASVKAYLDHEKLGRFAAFQDSKMALAGALGVQVLPTSILFDAKGREVWRYVGDLDWTSAEAAKLLAERGPSEMH